MSGSGGGITVSLPVSMSDGNYTVVFGNTSGQYEQLQLTSRKSASFSAKITNSGGSTTGCWQVIGYASI